MAVYRPTYTDPKTGNKVESEIFWCDFTYKRRRIRESTGQTTITRAKKYEERRRRELENAVAGVVALPSEDRIKDVKTTVNEWLEVRTAGKKPGTKAFIRERCKHLVKHLGSLLVCDVTAGRVAAYISAREAEGAAAVSINREVYMLSRVLRVDRDTAWPELGRSRKERAPVGRAITEDEGQALLNAAAANRSRYALPVIAAALYTGFRASEVRTLRWRQVDFIHGWIRSEESKTKAGAFREVPLLPELKRILLDHRAWIEKRLKAAPEPDHCVFPFSNRRKPVDPTRPITTIASAWWQVRKDAGVSCRLHDLRHSYVTRLIEAGNTEAIVRELVGHIDKTVIQRYTHVRRDAKKAAVQKAFSGVSSEHVKDSPKVSPLGAVKLEEAKPANSLPV